jgi:hypothetical protein
MNETKVMYTSDKFGNEPYVTTAGELIAQIVSIWPDELAESDFDTDINGNVWYGGEQITESL